MKIERLIGVIIILLQNQKVTASYLADRFNVSRRTIYRDLTDLSLAGIPVITQIGSDGGIMIDDDYKIDKTLFTKKELEAILTGLLTLDSVTLDNQYQHIIEKFTNKDQTYFQNHILIDLSSHYKNSLAIKIKDIQDAIDHQNKIIFDYYNVHGERKIILAPYLIVFQWSHWYVLGIPSDKDDIRMYKLNRLWNLQKTNNTFEFQDIPQEKLDFQQYFTDLIQVIILFDESVKYRLIEEYGIDCYQKLDNKKLYFERSFTNEDYLLEWVLSFGEKAELIEPHALRIKLKQKLEKMYKKYGEY